ncbi:hypothetical protein O3P69_014965, partial [Scylla paramamosain]
FSLHRAPPGSTREARVRKVVKSTKHRRRNKVDKDVGRQSEETSNSAGVHGDPGQMGVWGDWRAGRHTRQQNYNPVLMWVQACPPVGLAGWGGWRGHWQEAGATVTGYRALSTAQALLKSSIT